MSADGVRLERAGVPGGSSEMVRGNGQASGRKPAQPRGTARRRVGFLRQCWWLEKRLADTATWQSLVTLVRAVWGFRVVQEGLEGGGVKRTIADNSAGAFHCTWGQMLKVEVELRIVVGEVWPAHADSVEREKAFNGTCCKDPDRKEEPWRAWFPVFVIFLLLSRWFGTLGF